MVLFWQMVVLFLIMLLGLLCRKLNIFNDEVSKHLSTLVLRVTMPAMILSSAMNPSDGITGTDLLKTFLLSISMFALLMVLSIFVPIILRADKKDCGIYKTLTVFGNIAFMGFPLITAVCGSDALLYAAVFQIPFNALIYTFGIQAIRPKEESCDAQKKNPIKEFFNVGIIATLIAFVLFLTKFPVPSVIQSVADYVGNITPALSMLIIGDSLCKIQPRKLITNFRLLLFCFLRLLVIPVALGFLAKFCGIDGTLLSVFVILVSVPCASMNVMLAQEYNGNIALATEGVALSTILGVLTMPLVTMFF